MIKLIQICFIILIFLCSSLHAKIIVNNLGETLSFNIISSTSTSIEAKKGQSRVFGAMTIINNGKAFFDVSLSITHNSPWKLVENFTDRTDEIMFYGIFSDVKPSVSDFDKYDVILKTKKVSFSNIFAKESDKKKVKGYHVQSNGERHLFFRMDTPSETEHIGEEYKFNINITVLSLVKTSKEIGVAGGTVEIPGKISLYIPPGAIKESEEISIFEEHISLLPKGNGVVKGLQPFCAYEILPEGLMFRLPVSISMNYTDALISSCLAENLRIFYWDGFEWRYIGGEVDEEKKIVSSKITHFSVYAIFPFAGTPPYRPAEKIITPALNDRINDIAEFDGLSGKNVEINIYDITGRKARTVDVLKEGNIWDGKDDLGNIVESGIYIYQFQTEIDGKMKFISGTIVVAK